MYFTTLLLDVYIDDCYIFLMKWHFYYYEIFLFISGNIVFLDVYLIWYQYDHSSLLMLTVTHHFLHLLSSFRVHLLTGSEHIVGFCFLIHSDSLCFLIEMLSQLIVSVIIDQVQFKLTFYTLFIRFFLYLYSSFSIMLTFLEFYFDLSVGFLVLSLLSF